MDPFRSFRLSPPSLRKHWVKSIEWGASVRKCICRGGDRNSAPWGTIFQSLPGEVPLTVGEAPGAVRQGPTGTNGRPATTLTLPISPITVQEQPQSFPVHQWERFVRVRSHPLEGPPGVSTWEGAPPRRMRARMAMETRLCAPSRHRIATERRRKRATWVHGSLSAKTDAPNAPFPRLAALLAPICWASGAPIARALLSTAHPLPSSALVASRFAVSALVLAPLVAVDLRRRTKGEEMETEGLLRAAAELAFFLFLGNALVMESLRACGAGHAEFVVNAAKAVAVPSLAYLAGARVSKATWAGAAGVMAGLSLLTGTQGAGGATLADVGLLLAALCFSAHTQRMSVHAAKFDALPLTVTKLSIVAVMAMAVSVTRGDLSALSSAMASKEVLVLLFLSGAISVAGGMMFQATAQRNVGAAESQVIYATQPVWAALYAWGALGETMGGQEIVGGAVILLSSALSSAWDGRDPEA
eukprot:scaffold338_cov361-Pavlova_lutheri.AAC.14